MVNSLLLCIHFFTYRINGKTTCNARSIPSYAKLWDFDWLVNATCYEYVSESGEVVEVRVSCLKINLSNNICTVPGNTLLMDMN